MKTISALLYEIEDLLELNKLPSGHKVLQYDKQFGLHRMLEAGKDTFSANTKRFVYLLLEPPKLPEIVIPGVAK